MAEITQQRAAYLQGVKTRARAFAKEVVRLYNPPNNIPAKEIAKRFTNPATGKPYTVPHIFLILRKARRGEL